MEGEGATSSPSPVDTSSDSDDELEEPPLFMKMSQSDTPTPDVSFEVFNYSPPKKPSRLDALLAEHREETEKAERMKLLRDQLLEDIRQGSNEDRISGDGEDLASEHANHIEQLEVRSSELRHIHPGLPVFSETRFCCLFTENITPFSCGFTSSNIRIDKILASTTPANIATLLNSKVLLVYTHEVSCLDSVMQWLLNLLSVHSSPAVVQSCYMNLTGIINQQKIDARSGRCWVPTALDLLRLLVNLGATSSDLIGNQTYYSEKEIREHLSGENDENTRHRPKQQVCSDNLGKVLSVVAASLQARPKIAKEELNFMFYMLAKASLDVSLQSTLCREFLVCFSSIIECYGDADWPSVVPELCGQLCGVTDHHHNQAYLVNSLPVGPRGSYLRVRLSFSLLRRLLLSSQTDLDDSTIHDLQILDIVSLGDSRQGDASRGQGHVSLLSAKLQDLVQTDLYKAASALKLLDFSVGDELHRSTHRKDHLEYLLSQVNLVIKTMKDRVSELDVSKVKDAMSRLTVKWSLTLQQRRLTQRSIFPWATADTHQRVTEERLEDGKEDSDEG